MKKIYSLLVFTFFTAIVFGQISITATGTAFTQNFDGIGSGAAATLPSGFKIGTDWAASTITTTTFAAGTTGTGILSTTASGGVYNFATGVNASSTDRAIGFLTSSGYSSPRSIILKITNGTSSNITDLLLSFDYEKYRNHSRGTDLTFFHGNTVTASTAEIAGNQSYAADAAVAILNPPTTITKTFTITSLSIAPGTDYYLRWTYTGVGGSSNSQGLAIDNFSVTANGGAVLPCAEPSSVPTALTFNTPLITPTSIPASFTGVTADKYIVIRSLVSTLTANPVDGTVYAVNSSLGGGTVISNGTSTSFVDNGLTQTTTYYYFVFAYNDAGCSGGPNYNVTSYPAPNFATTLAVGPCLTPSSLVAPLTLIPTNTNISGSFTGNGSSKYLVIRSSTMPPLGASPTDGTVYTIGQTLGNGTVISYGTATTFVTSGLTVATTYYFYVFALNDNCGGEPFYNTTSLDGTATTTNVTIGIPPGYYNATAGLTCAPLKNALSTIITTGHTALAYSTIDNVQMPVVDTIRSDDGNSPIIWDIYSNNNTGVEPFVFNSTQATVGGFCGATSPANEGVCWNKEHTFPKSYFKTGSSSYQQPTEADLFVVRATDLRINAFRGNLPYSLVGGSTSYTFPATTSTFPGVPILDKIGASTAGGFTATAFEPANSVKGDVARAYFYVLTRYQNNLSTWVSANTTTAIATVVDGTTGGGTYPSFQLPYLTMMYNWHLADPVDAKEINRNNLVYSQQNNRNPYIDNPAYVALVFQCTGALPVTIIDFTATKKDESVLLTWYATQETAFKKYEVERSVDGRIFNKIGEVEGKNLANYNFTDNDLPRNSVVYYRLKMIDIDGRNDYSKIVSIKLNKNLSNALVYPNPALDNLNIKLYQLLGKNSTLTITDVAGRIVKQQAVNINTVNISIDVKTLSSGRYFVKIVNENQIINESFVIIK
jgi:endonuclease I